LAEVEEPGPGWPGLLPLVINSRLEMIDPALGAAISVQSHRGIYAVLLGSGVSRSAAIPTGWEIVEDLARRVALASGDTVGNNWEQWYLSKFGKQPNYSDLVAAVAPMQTERMSLLKAYFEPTEEQKEQGLKLPTAAHRAIARLVASGHIRVIITTNFDRLMEQALEAEKVNPTVISSPAQVAGMMPLPHVNCLVLKIHGDYLDTRIKNTTGELSNYEQEINVVLDRVLSEFGLIVCGWSADWDIALSDAILRNSRFRFSTYWMAKGKLTERGDLLVKHRQALVIPIEAADAAFTKLEAMVRAIEAGTIADPVSPRVAIAMTKRYLSDIRYRIAKWRWGIQNRIKMTILIVSVELKRQRQTLSQLLQRVPIGVMKQMSCGFDVLKHWRAPRGNRVPYFTRGNICNVTR
jgi:hypothetical protein